MLAVVLAVTVYVSRTAPFLAGDFLSDLAWKYSALLSLPLAWLVLKLGQRDRMIEGPRIVVVPLALYFMVARLVLAIPNGCVDLGDYPHASEP